MQYSVPKWDKLSKNEKKLFSDEFPEVAKVLEGRNGYFV
jgi:hypothetical protein